MCAASTAISSATFYKWRAKLGGFDVSDAKRLGALEDENAKIGRSDARQCGLEGHHVPKVVMPEAKTQAVTHAATS
jgi:hypothetical protein